MKAKTGTQKKRKWPLCILWCGGEAASHGHGARDVPHRLFPDLETSDSPYPATRHSPTPYFWKGHSKALRALSNWFHEPIYTGQIMSLPLEQLEYPPTDIRTAGNICTHWPRGVNSRYGYFRILAMGFPMEVRCTSSVCGKTNTLAVFLWKR
jgi:hypothetical protein